MSEVLDGVPVAEVARRYDTSRQSLHTWLRRFREGGRDFEGPPAPAAHIAVASAGRGGTRHLPRHLAPEALLPAVPFDHLVPREEMLPEESVRFFHVDRQWLDAAVAGAVSTGAVTSLDSWTDGLLCDRLDTTSSDAPVAGVLVHSLLIRSWPRLIVEATTEGGAAMNAKAVRVSRPLPDVLLVLLSHKPGSLTLREPPHGLSLGIATHGDKEHRGTINLRAPWAMGSKKPGVLLDKTAKGIDDCMRAGQLPGSEVLRVKCDSGNHLVGKVSETISGLTEAALALQLVNSAGFVTFTKK